MFKDKDGNICHVGNLPLDEWHLDGPWQTKTHKDVDVVLYVATEADVERLIDSPAFPEPYTFPELVKFHPFTLRILLNAFTSFRFGACPYLCLAEVNREIAGRLFLDRNSNNAIRRGLGAAIVDDINVHPDFEGQGVADKLLEFAENLARSNGIRWLEIGAAKVESTEDRAHARRGTDSLRSYIRRGFHEMPLYPARPLEICYPAGGQLPGLVTPRYGRYGSSYGSGYGSAVVVYKDLNSDIQMDAEVQKQLYQRLVAGIPSPPA